MQWQTTLSDLQQHLNANMSEPVYMGNWASVPQVSAVHLIPGNRVIDEQSLSGDYELQVFLECWVTVNPSDYFDESQTDQQATNTLRLAAYDELNALENRLIEEVLEWKNAYQDIHGILFTQADSDQDVFAPTHGSRLTATLLLSSNVLCGD